jgi:hypothetical protein
MKHRLAWIAAFVLVLGAFLALPATAQATYTWHHVGGDPLVSGGVWDTGKFSYLELNSAKVRLANALVAEANGLPSWVLPAAYKQIAAGNIKSSTIPVGTRVGAMSYGRSVVRVVKDTIYHGQYARLPYYYVNASRTSVVTINGMKYRQTMTYRVSMAKPCGNVYIFMKTVVRVRLYELYVEKRANASTGARLADWQIKGKVGSSTVSKITSSNGCVFVGYYPAGTRINLVEVGKEEWVTIVGAFNRTMPSSNLTLTFVNKVKTYPLYVEKRQDTVMGCFLANWTVKGTIGGKYFEVKTSSNGPILVGNFPSGTAFDLSEVSQSGWEVVSPSGGRFAGITDASDKTLTYVNKQKVYKLYVEKRADSTTGERLANWQIKGSAGTSSVNLTTNSSTPVLVGEFIAGTSYDLQETLQSSWVIVSPSGGRFVGTMPSSDVTLTFVNRYCAPTFKLYVEKRKDTSNGSLLADWTIKGYVGGKFYEVKTSTSGPTLIGEFPAGTSYDLSEILQSGWEFVSPTSGRFTGTTGSTSSTLVFVNKPCPPPTYKLYVNKWFNSVGGERIAGVRIIGHVGSKQVDMYSSGTGSVLLGEFVAGEDIYLKETLATDQFAISPANGIFTGKTTSSVQTVDFVNGKYCPPQKYKLYVEKRADSTLGLRLAGWQIKGSAGTSSVNLITNASTPVLVGEFVAGTSYDLSEVLQSDWVIVSPSGGRFVGTMPSSDVTLTFVNRYCAPHEMSIETTVSGVYCGDRNFFAASCGVVVKTHNDNDKVHIAWTIDGVSDYEDQYIFTKLLSYDTTHTIIVTVSDTAGHSVDKEMKIKKVGPGPPPPVN